MDDSIKHSIVSPSRGSCYRLCNRFYLSLRHLPSNQPPIARDASLYRTANPALRSISTSASMIIPLYK